MGIDPADRVDIVDKTEQMMMDPQLHLAANLQGRLQKHVQGVIDHALGGVFYRRHAIIGGTRLDFPEDFIDGRKEVVRTPKPKCFRAAAWVNVPSGPRKAMVSGSSRARQADIIPETAGR